MIPVKKTQDPKPTGLTSAGATRKKKALMIEGNSHEISSYYYAHDTVKTALNAQYHKKCCYCERYIIEQGDRRVEHYRPKKARDEPETHSGSECVNENETLDVRI